MIRLSNLVRQGGFRCEGNRRDRYDRLLSVCYAGETDINREMVSSGLAVSYGSYKSTEISARLAGKGAWSGSFVEPSAWRAGEGRQAEARHDIVSRLLRLVRDYLF